jgi:Ca-activated chloride channel family protein
MFRFESPESFQYLILIPLALALAAIASSLKAKKIQKAFDQRLSAFLSASQSQFKKRWRLALQALCLLFMVLALARPQAGQSTQEIKSEGIEIMMMVDVSNSMLAEDLRPSRLAQAQLELAKLLDLLPGSKVGLVAFAGSAALLSPLTTDPGALKLYLDSLSPLSVSSQGTNFLSGLQMSHDSFKKGGVEVDESTKVTRVILVASDGEDHEQGALDYLEELKKEGIRVFTVAYGTEKGAPIPVRDELGYLRGYHKDKAGQTVLTQVKGDFLKTLAEKGQGSFYFSTFAGPHLQNLVEDFNRLEKSQFSSQMAVQYEEYYQSVLFLGLLFGLFALLMSERKQLAGRWRGRFEVPR